MEDHKLAKLPKWAQIEIGMDSQKIRALEQDIAVLKGDFPDNGVRVMTDMMDDNCIPLPTDSAIRFDIDDGYVEVLLDEYNGKLGLGIRGSRELVIRPLVSNSIRVYPENF